MILKLSTCNRRSLLCICVCRAWSHNIFQFFVALLKNFPTSSNSLKMLCREGHNLYTPALPVFNLHRRIFQSIILPKLYFVNDRKIFKETTGFADKKTALCKVLEGPEQESHITPWGKYVLEVMPIVSLFRIDRVDLADDFSLVQRVFLLGGSVCLLTTDSY